MFSTIKRRGRSRRNRNTAAKRRQKAASKKIILIAAMIFIPVAILTGTVFVVTGEMKKIKIDVATYCFDGQPGQYQAAYFIDYSVTDFASTEQIRDLRNAFELAYDDLPVNGKIYWFSTARDVSSSIVKPTFFQCKPAETPQNAENIGVTVSTAAFHKNQFGKAKDAYMTEVDRLIDERANNASKASPLFEQIGGIGQYFKNKGLDKLYVYTDGIQTSSIAQFCQTQGHLPPFTKFKNTRTYHLVKLSKNYEGVDVEIQLVEWLKLPSVGLEFCSNDELRKFWPKYFEDAGATVTLKRLEFGTDQAKASETNPGEPDELYDCGKCHIEMRKSEVVLNHPLSSWG